MHGPAGPDTAPIMSSQGPNDVIAMLCRSSEQLARFFEILTCWVCIWHTCLLLLFRFLNSRYRLRMADHEEPTNKREAAEVVDLMLLEDEVWYGTSRRHGNVCFY